MKKTITLATALLLSATMLYAEPESKMEKSFKQMFPNAEGVKWHEDADNYLVSFTQAGNAVKIVYDKSGKFLQSLRYYGEKDLPTNILLAVKSKYAGKTIFGVTERTTSTDVTYHISIMDGTTPQTITAYSNGTIKEDAAVTETEE